MSSNVDKYKQSLEKLIENGNKYLSDLLAKISDKKDDKGKVQVGSLFCNNYQKWYSEAHEVIRQLLPTRLVEFEQLYRLEKRKTVDALTFTIQDWLIGVRASEHTYTGEKHFNDEAVVFMKFNNQLEILKSITVRFESSLFDIKRLVQADIFDSELDVAHELLKNGFIRAAGAVAGVVLEKHLSQICGEHQIKIKKRNTTISEYNDILKNENVIEIHIWRNIQLLGDLRNLCDHDKKREPKEEEILDLINGVEKIIKSVF